MFLGISKTLKKMGGFRLHLGLNLKKWYTWFILLFVGIFYAMYYLMLAVLWMLYGIAWCLYKLGIWWIALFKTLKKGWQKGVLVGGTALLVLILAIIVGAAGSKSNTPTAEIFETVTESVTDVSVYGMADDLLEDTTSVSTAPANTTMTTTITTKASTTTTTTKPTTTTTTTAKPSTTTTTSNPTTTTTARPTTTTTTTKPTIEKTTSPTVIYQTSSSYVLNTNTMRIHYPSCSSVNKILPENYAETNDYNGAIQAGYKPCGNCHPQ